MTGVVEPNNRMISGSGNGRFRAQFWKTELCRFWRSGCRNGKLCPFAHGDDELSARPDLAKTSLCQRWAKGSCPLEASECRFAHGHLDLRATINFSSASPQAELDMNSQMNTEPGILQVEAPILSTGPGSPPPLGSQRNGPPMQPPPRMWEEDGFSNLHTYSAGPSADMSWGGRNQSNEWNEAVLGQRSDWQWSAEYSDTAALGHVAGEDARNRRSRRARAKAAHELGLTASSGASMAVDPAVSSNGRPPPPPPPLQQVLSMGGQMPPTGQLLVNGRRPHEGIPGLTHTDAPWGQPRGGSAVMNGGWPDPVQAFAPMAQQQRQNYSALLVQEVSEFPHAITTPEANIMNSLVPEELRAIWG